MGGVFAECVLWYGGVDLKALGPCSFKVVAVVERSEIMALVMGEVPWQSFHWCLNHWCNRSTSLKGVYTKVCLVERNQIKGKTADPRRVKTGLKNIEENFFLRCLYF